MTSRIPRHRIGENVIQADFGFTRQEDLRLELHEEAHSAGRTRASSELSWVESAFHDLMSENAEHGRFQRGLAYFRDGAVSRIATDTNTIAGAIEGSQLEPFNASLTVTPLGETRLRSLTHELTVSRAAFLSLLRGDTPPRSLVDTLLRPTDIAQLSCSCPDPNAVCKHLVALALAAGRSFSQVIDQFLIWRGLDIEELCEIHALGPVEELSHHTPDVQAMLDGVAAHHRSAAAAQESRRPDPQQVHTEEELFGPREPIRWVPLSTEPGCPPPDDDSLAGVLFHGAWSRHQAHRAQDELAIVYDWLTDHPADMLDELDPDWEERLQDPTALGATTSGAESPPRTDNDTDYYAPDDW